MEQQPFLFAYGKGVLQCNDVIDIVTINKTAESKLSAVLFIISIQIYIYMYLICNYSFTPPSATPAMMYFESMKYTIRSGNTVRVSPTYT